MSALLRHRRSPLYLRAFLLALASSVALAAAGPAAAQPFGQYLVLDGDDTDYIEIPHHPQINPASAITVEGWVRLDGLAPDCDGLIGKGYQTAYWIGICDQTLRSYIRSGVPRDGGDLFLGLGGWNHFAVTSDGVSRRHYIDGLLVEDVPEAGPPGTNTEPVRIGSDVHWFESPAAAIDELRLWNVARTGAQIQATMFEDLSTDLPGLVAVWAFEGAPDDELGTHHGVEHGTIEYAGTTPPPPGPWITDPEFPDFEFKVQIRPPGNPPLPAAYEPLCLPETVCVSGALPGRTEVELRIIGPRPNGYLWVNLVRFTVSGFRVWIRQVSTDQVNYYSLLGVPADSDDLPGRVDKEAFLP